MTIITLFYKRAENKSLIGLKSRTEVEESMQLGMSFEGFAIREIMKACTPDEAYFWSSSNQAELDLLLIKDGKKMTFEFKHSYTPKITRSMHIAMKDLELDSLTIIIPKGDPYRLSPNTSVCGVKEWCAVAG